MGHKAVRGRGIKVAATLAAVLLFISAFSLFLSAGLGLGIERFGVIPRQLDGLWGLLFAPLIHGSFDHWASNALPTALLLLALGFGYPKTGPYVVALVWLGSGLGVWLFGRSAVHMGASGLTHGLFFYVFIASLVRRDRTSIAIMMAAFFLYGGMLLSVLPRDPSISFESHFFGALVGTLCALSLGRIEPRRGVRPRKPLPEHDDDDALIGDAWRTERTDHPQNNRE